MAFSPDGQTILTGNRDRTARLWNAADGSPIGKAMPHMAPITVVAFRPDGRAVLTASWDFTARLWKVPRPLDGDPQRIELWAQVITGLELNENDVIRPLDEPTWRARREQLDALGGPPTP